MKNRMYPFGYKMENGAVVIVPEEAEIIRKIFNDYVAGVSLKRLAESLTAKRIEYLPDRCCGTRIVWSESLMMFAILGTEYMTF